MSKILAQKAGMSKKALFLIFIILQVMKNNKILLGKDKNNGMLIIQNYIGVCNNKFSVINLLC